MPSNLTSAILKTISYSDVFNHPLTLSEIHKFLISAKANQQTIAKVIKNIKPLKEKNGFYFFKGNEKNIEMRLMKETISLEKLSSAKKFAKILFLFPTIKVIAVSGSLALLSSDRNDDIDFLIITSNQRIWAARFFCVLFLKLLGVYRQPNISTAPDKICVNMFLDENHLSIPNAERDLYSAHEIVQARQLLFRPGYENILLRANPWLKKYLPNTFVIPSAVEGSSKFNRQNLLSKFFDTLEYFLKNFQLFYMHRRRTTEVIREGYLRFHPRDARKYILSEYEKRIKKYLIPDYTSEV